MNNKELQEWLRQDVNQIVPGDEVFHRLTGNKGKVQLLQGDYFGIYWYGGQEGEKLQHSVLHSHFVHKNLVLKLI